MPKYIPPHLRKRLKNKDKDAKKKGTCQKTPEKKSTLGPNQIQTVFGIVDIINIDNTDPKGKYADLCKTDIFARAFLTSKRRGRSRTGTNSEPPREFYWIRNKAGETVVIGCPEDWPSDVAFKIKAGEYEIKKIRCQRKQNDRKCPKFHRRRFTSTRSPFSRKKTKQEIGENVMVCAKTDRGPRAINEDRYVYVPDFEKLNPRWEKYGGFPKLSYFGVYDGHGGPVASSWAADKLHKCIAKNIGKEEDLCIPILKGYLQFDDEFCSYAIENENSSGSCAVSVIIQGNTLYVANIGDCAAVICRSGDTIVLSDEHPLATNEEERRRVHKEGGNISCDGRLNGDLNVSRAFGDVCGFDNSGTGPQKMVGLTCRPVVKKHFLTKDDEFLIIACDGIFDFVNYKNSVQAVRRTLRKTNNVETAGTKLIEYARKVPSTDNMTCMIVGFPKMDQEGKMRIVKPLNDFTGSSYSHHDMGSRPQNVRRGKIDWSKLGDAMKDNQE